jgi:hypothetical protein
VRSPLCASPRATTGTVLVAVSLLPPSPPSLLTRRVVTTSSCHVCAVRLSKCGREFYVGGADGSLGPCIEGSLVCSRLNAIVSSGRELCERMGYDVAAKSGTRKCYDGSGVCRAQPAIHGVRCVVGQLCGCCCNP